MKTWQLIRGNTNIPLVHLILRDGLIYFALIYTWVSAVIHYFTYWRHFKDELGQCHYLLHRATHFARSQHRVKKVALFHIILWLTCQYQAQPYANSPHHLSVSTQSPQILAQTRKDSSAVVHGIIHYPRRVERFGHANIFNRKLCNANRARWEERGNRLDFHHLFVSNFPVEILSVYIWFTFMSCLWASLYVQLKQVNEHSWAWMST